MALDREKVFEEILVADGAALRRIAAAREADPARREDLVQEIFLAVWTALPRFRNESSLRTFVFAIAHNQALRHIARNATWKHDEMDAGNHVADATALNPEERASQAQKGDRLRQAMRKLPGLQSEALSLMLEGFTHGEIAGILGTTENGVAIRLSRARNALRAELRRHEEGS